MSVTGERARKAAEPAIFSGASTRRPRWGFSSRFLPVLLLVLGIACAAPSPLARLQDSLKDYPEYSISLEDMKEEGNFFKEYYHRYKIVHAEVQPGSEDLHFESVTTDWYPVSEKEFQRNQNNLGMVILSKTREEGVATSPQPPGYQYVGDSRYGNWKTDNRGNSFWEFYGKYAFFTHIFGMMSGPVYRPGWNTYRDYRSRGQPFYGTRSQYGTSGASTRTAHKDFFERRKVRETARKARFSDKVKSRVRRSKMSGVRTRSRGFGK